MKKRIYCSLMILLCLFLCCCQAQETTALRIKEESYFNDFVIEDETVTFYCTLSIQNETDETKTVKLHGDFTEDYESGLILEAKLQAFDPQNGDTTFLLAPGENRFEIAFSCQQGGRTNQKQNRLLPEISITEVQND